MDQVKTRIIPIIIGLLGIMAIILIVAGVGKLARISKIAEKVLPVTPAANILYITMPVHSFSGRIDKIAGNSIFVSRDLSAGPQTPTASLPVKKISYKVNITNNTFMGKANAAVPYLLKSQTVPATGSGSAALAPLPPRLAVKDLKVGDFVDITTNTDLRTLSSDEFEATNINLSAPSISFTGQIVGMKGNVLTVKGRAMLTQADARPQETTYQVTVTDDTEISRYSLITSPGQMPKAERDTLDDLKKDMQITVYTDQDVSQKTNLTALRIEPMIMVNPPISTSSATSAARIKP